MWYTPIYGNIWQIHEENDDEPLDFEGPIFVRTHMAWNSFSQLTK